MERGKMSSLKNVIRVREAGVFGALCLIVVIMSILSPYFLRPDNIFNVLRGMSTIGIISIGMTMIIITGGIDLSVGSILGVTAMFTARLMYQGISPVLAIFGGFGLGCLLGFTNGIIITKVKIAPFIVTLGMLSIGRGLTYLLATGLRGTVASNIPMTNEFIGYLGAGYIGPIPFPVIEMTILVVLFSLFVKYTVIGRQIYAVGSNEEAADCPCECGFSQLFVYTTTGALCTRGTYERRSSIHCSNQRWAGQ